MCWGEKAIPKPVDRRKGNVSRINFKGVYVAKKRESFGLSRLGGEGVLLFGALRKYYSRQEGVT